MFNYYPSRQVATVSIGLIATLGSIVLLTLQGNGSIEPSILYPIPGAAVVIYWLLDRCITDAVREGNRLSMIDMMMMQSAGSVEDDTPDGGDDNGDAPQMLNADSFRKAVAA